MGYPMRWDRVVRRNHLDGDYFDRPSWQAAQETRETAIAWVRSNIAGDLRRLEADTRDPRHLDAYARLAGITPDQVRTLFDAFFSDYPPQIHLDWDRFPRTEGE